MHQCRINTLPLLLTLSLLLLTTNVWAQKGQKRHNKGVLSTTDSIVAPPPPAALLRRLGVEPSDSAAVDSIASLNMQAFEAIHKPIPVDSIVQAPMPTIEQVRWMPDPKRATWLALLIPGGGQIYNRKYWKLPIVYGGFVACAYALNWNNQMYADYAQAYLDIMDDDPNTNSYQDFLPANYSIAGRESTYQNIFKKRKDYYRRYRDISIFCFIGVYVLSVIDAYVDAELSNYDISHELGLHIEPTVIDNKVSKKSTVGLQCSITF